ncbi:HNH endonuclease [Xanthomonas phage L522]|nr:HNH endonuclease [Xanthomonas phage L522]
MLRWKVDRAPHVNAGSIAGSTNNRGYLQVQVYGKLYKSHRLAWLLHTGKWPSQHIDHINGRKTDNRIENLRECTHAENHQNRGKNKNNTTGVLGVCLEKNGKWRARICVDGKDIFLGYFETLEAAAAARAEAKKRLHTFNPVAR